MHVSVARLRIGVGIGAGDPFGDALDQLRIGIARLVGIHRRPSVMRAGLETVQGVVERVHGVAARLGIQLHHRWEWVAPTPKVRDRLPRRAYRQVRKEPRDPWPGRHDDRLRVDVVKRRSRGLLCETRAVCNSAVDESTMREICAHDPGLRLKEGRPAVGDAERPATARLA